MDLLQIQAPQFGIELSPSQLRAFEVYYHELSDWNARFNLTTITSYEDVQRKHFLDSLLCLTAFPQEFQAGANSDSQMPAYGKSLVLRCADVGSGAGFPGIPLKILLPGIQLSLIEATAKKAAFLEHMICVLGLSGVEVVCSRAETVGHDRSHREQCDVVLARAVARLSVLAEYCLPLLRVGGCWIAQKGDGIEDELLEMSDALRALGGELKEVKPYSLSDIAGSRYLVLVLKVAPTPSRYPRRVGIPTKRPLGSTVRPNNPEIVKAT